MKPSELARTQYEFVGRVLRNPSGFAAAQPPFDKGGLGWVVIGRFLLDFQLVKPLSLEFALRGHPAPHPGEGFFLMDN